MEFGSLDRGTRPVFFSLQYGNEEYGPGVTQLAHGFTSTGTGTLTEDTGKLEPLLKVTVGGVSITIISWNCVPYNYMQLVIVFHAITCSL